MGDQADHSEENNDSQDDAEDKPVELEILMKTFMTGIVPNGD